MEKALEVHGLKKHYGPVKAVDGIDFYLNKGELFAFLGPNGSGKSTTIDMICTYLKPDAGRADINGFELGREDDKIRNSVGVVFQDGLLDGLLTVSENLTARASLYGLWGAKLKEAVAAGAEKAGVTELLSQRYGRLSGGEKRRCDIARALVNTPKILFLDEPTTGLDPQARKDIWQTIEDLRRGAGTTVFLTTHYMEEAAGADYVHVIKKGKIIAGGTPAELKEKHTNDRLTLSSANPKALCALLGEKNLNFSVCGNKITVSLESTMEAIGVLDEIKRCITGFEVMAGTMDDAFINIIGKDMEK
ncbi:MAG: ABC transporter ATP-binding protein [Eubacteriales bacterium]